MADYKRLVSYMYRYENNTKCNNIGYARIETRNGQCKITIHIKAMHHSSLPIHAYMYLWLKGKMVCVSLGIIEIRNGIGDFKVVSDVNDLMESGFRLDEMSGIMIYVSQNTFYGTEWDDQIINCTGLHIVKRKEDLAVNKYETIEKPQENMKEVPFDDVVLGAAELNDKEVSQQEAAPSVEAVEIESEEKQEPEVESESKVMEQEIFDPNVMEDEVDKLDIAAEKSFDEVIKEVEEDDITLCEQETELEHMELDDDAEKDLHKVDIDPVKSIEFLTGFKKCESDSEEKELKVQMQQLQEQIEHLQSVIDEYHQQKEEKVQTESVEQKEEKIQTESVEQQDDMPVVSRIFAQYPKLEPFNDELVEKCVKIEPQDIGIFPMENWILANNSFLLHGYYSYRHLIFAKLHENNKTRYILGVPGVNQSREKNMAEMFGFKKFQKIKNADQKDGEFGYWCLDINFK